MTHAFTDFLQQQLDDTRRQGLEKRERLLRSPQRGRVEIAQGQVLNLCANNYLGFADDPDILQAAEEGMQQWGFGMASVRFICGTQEIHAELEAALCRLLGTQETILYSSCFDANGGLFETLLGAEDAIVSDALNHASVIDGIRLCKARRLRYRNNDMDDLRAQLESARDARFRMIATDGVFSMDGSLARLPDICELADNYDALVMVDDSHGVGVLGATGAGTAEHFGVAERIDVVTGTLGKALGGASGGYTSGRKEIVDWLRQRSRPYLFSNSLAPCIVSAALKGLELLRLQPQRRDALRENTAYFRREIEGLGFDVLPGEHPIIPILLGDARLAAEAADQLLRRGVYVVGFSFPVVPRDQARIRTQMSAAHSRDDLAFAVEQFAALQQELGK